MKMRTTVILLTALLVVSLLGAYWMNRSSEKAPPKLPELTMFGRASIKLKLSDDKIIYIDPYAGTAGDYAEAADLVLMTHDDSDHNDVSLVTLKDDAKIFQGAANIKPGETISEKGIQITAVDAYNSRHPKGSGVGFILKLDGITLYHSGDTSYFEEMSAWPAYNIDYALLCMDGYYNMAPEEALKVAEAIAAKWVIPMHTDKAADYNATNADAFSSPHKLNLKPGETLKLKPSD